MGIKNKAAGCLLGLAVGDAVGTTLEFKERGTFEEITDMVGGGPFYLEAGQWTDDTSMALCLGQSLIEHQRFIHEDQLTKYVNWYRNGYMSCTNECFDIGDTTVNALREFESTGAKYCGINHPTMAGNGSLMRLAPVPIYFYDNIQSTIEYAGESSRTTHGASECIDSCKYYASLIHLALNGASKEDIITGDLYSPNEVRVQEIASLEYRNKTRDEIKGSGYVIESMEAALWCFDNTNSYEEAVLLAANLGDDADTTAAIVGQLAGAYYGFTEIPEHWKQRVAWNATIISMSQQLIEDYHG